MRPPPRRDRRDRNITQTSLEAYDGLRHPSSDEFPSAGHHPITTAIVAAGSLRCMQIATSCCSGATECPPTLSLLRVPIVQILTKNREKNALVQNNEDGGVLYLCRSSYRSTAGKGRKPGQVISLQKMHTRKRHRLSTRPARTMQLDENRPPLPPSPAVPAKSSARLVAAATPRVHPF